MVAAASDVFLSYSRADADAVAVIRARLTEAGVTSFLDRTKLPAGQPWQPFLEKELGRSRAVAVFVGRHMGSWQHREVQVALDRQSRENDFPVIPILLPGLDDEPKGFLRLQTWVDLRADPDDPVQLQNLIAAIHRKAREGAAGIKAAICPYRGLLPFREEDAAFFFGRDEWIDDLTTKVQAHRLVAVVGRSGSGKSSLVFAGLFPALRKSPGGTTWDMLALRPGREPLNALAAALSPPPEGATPADRIEKINADADRLRRGTVRLDQLVRDHLDRQPGTDRLLLYVDQWEELYTLAARPGDASKTEPDGQAGSQGAAQPTHANADVVQFIDLLLAAASEQDSPLTVVLTVRADFYDHLLRHPTLPSAIQGQQVNLRPMTRAQLQQCIGGPAAAVGLGFEGNLVESILDDVSEDEGKLPLLEYALRETWEASRKTWQNGGAPGVLTFAAYNGIGRVGGAIGTRAEQIYERLDEAQQQAARSLFVSLVTPGEGQEDTRARATVPDEPAMAEVVREFSDPAARLLVTGWDESRGERLAEVSHEALIRNWGTLRNWIEANREILRTRENVRARMRQWEEQGQDRTLLLPAGLPLEEGRKLLADHGDVLVGEVQPYIETSIAVDATAEKKRRLRQIWITAIVALATFLLVTVISHNRYQYWLQMQPWSALTSIITGKTYGLKEDVAIIGRLGSPVPHFERQVKLFAPNISRIHMLITRNLQAIDLRSSYGTIKNGESFLKYNTVEQLADGDILVVAGETAFKFYGLENGPLEFLTTFLDDVPVASGDVELARRAGWGLLIDGQHRMIPLERPEEFLVVGSDGGIATSGHPSGAIAVVRVHRDVKGKATKFALVPTKVPYGPPDSPRVAHCGLIVAAAADAADKMVSDYIHEVRDDRFDEMLSIEVFGTQAAMTAEIKMTDYEYGTLQLEKGREIIGLTALGDRNISLVTQWLLDYDDRRFQLILHNPAAEDEEAFRKAWTEIRQAEIRQERRPLSPCSIDPRTLF